MWATSQYLHIGIIQPIILGYFKAKVISILEKINVTLWFTHKFMHEQLDWKFGRSTIAHGKLPCDWEIQRPYMTYHIAYLMFLYNILASLVDNTNQRKM
jgi:hypothetical protein